jgi:transcriptional regulator with XRE-family HTH domain
MATLKELRKSRGISQVELAIHLGVSPSSIYKLEAGRQMPKFPLVRRICAYFDVPLDSLEFGRPTGPPTADASAAGVTNLDAVAR